MICLYSRTTGVCCYGYRDTPSWCFKIFDLEAHEEWHREYEASVRKPEPVLGPSKATTPEDPDP